MNEALNYIYYIFNSLIALLFNLYIFDNVSIGMIVIVIFIFSILIRSILNIPNGLVNSLSRSYSNKSKEEG